MIEHGSQFYRVPAFHDRIGRLRREVIHKCLAACLGLLFRQSDDRRIKPTLAEQAAARLVTVANHISHITLHKRFLVSRQLSELPFLAAFNPCVPAFKPETGHEEVHLVLVATDEDLYVSCRAVGIGLKGVGRQVFPVSFRELVQEVHSGCCLKESLAVNLQKVTDALAAERFHQPVGTFDGFFRSSRQVDGAALGDEPLEIPV